MTDVPERERTGDGRIRVPIRTNLLALISLVVALVALGYNTWRNEPRRTRSGRGSRDGTTSLERLD